MRSEGPIGGAGREAWDGRVVSSVVEAAAPTCELRSLRHSGRAASKVSPLTIVMRKTASVVGGHERRILETMSIVCRSAARNRTRRAA